MLRKPAFQREANSPTENLRFPECEVIVVIVESASTDQNLLVTDRTILQWIQVIAMPHTMLHSYLHM
jgi:hypothetical protein